MEEEQSITLQKIPIEKRLEKYIVVLGTTGTGKSTIVNMLYNNDCSKTGLTEPAKTAATTNSVTKSSDFFVNVTQKTIYCDTVGLGDPELSNGQIVRNLRDLLRSSVHGVTGLIVVVKWARMNVLDRANLNAITELFDDRWRESSILVITNFDREFRNAEEEIRNWQAGDNEAKEIIEKFKHVVVADNSLGRYEEQNRPFRQETLENLNRIIAGFTSPFGLKPKRFLDLLRIVLEKYFSVFNKSKERLNAAYQCLIEDTQNYAGECSLCLDDMKLSTLCYTKCRHRFHMTCFEEAYKKRHLCPICREPVESVKYFPNPNPGFLEEWLFRMEVG